MEIRAEPDHKFNRRNIFLFIFGVGVTIWALYDLAVTAPKTVEQIEMYQEIKEEIRDSDEQKLEYIKRAREKGWSHDLPKKTMGDMRFYYWFNYSLVAVGSLAAVFFLIKFIRVRNSWFAATNEHLTNSFGAKIKLDSIEKVNKARWEKKGIARVFYKDDQGASQFIVLDDFKYEREPMGEIMAQIEKGLSAEQIEEGPSQAEIKIALKDQQDEKSDEEDEVNDTADDSKDE